MSENYSFNPSHVLVQQYLDSFDRNTAKKQSAPCSKLTALLRPYFNAVVQLIQPMNAQCAANDIASALYRGLSSHTRNFTSPAWVDTASYVANQLHGISEEDRMPIAQQALNELKTLLQSQNSVCLWDSDVSLQDGRFVLRHNQEWLRAVSRYPIH